MKAVSSFKTMSSCFSEHGGPYEDREIRVGEGLKSFGAMKKVCSVRSVGLGVKSKLCERLVVSTLTYGAEKHNVMENKYLRSMCELIKE